MARGCKLDALRLVVLSSLCFTFTVLLITFNSSNILIPTIILQPKMFSNTTISQTCIMTSEVSGRLGNTMFEYGALYSLARLHNCEAVLPAAMEKNFHGCFNVSMKMSDVSQFRSIQWMQHSLPYLMDDDNFNVNTTGSLVLLKGYPSDWRYFQKFDADIRREFLFITEVKQQANEYLHYVRRKRRESSVTYVGVHVRRSDYIPYLKRHGCVSADANYLLTALKMLYEKYSDSVFILATDDLRWCKTSLNGSKFDVSFVPPQMSACRTLAILSLCNHSIVTHGSFGFWSAYLAGGDTAYPTENCNDRTNVLRKLSAMNLPHWLAIPSDGYYSSQEPRGRGRANQAQPKGYGLNDDN